MRRYILVVAGIGLAFAAYKRTQKTEAPPPPPTPAPPPIVLPVPKPAPILSPDEMRRISEATRDSDENVRWEAARFLMKLEHPDADAVLFHMLAKDPAPSLRLRVAELLADRPRMQGEKPRADVSRALVGALRDIESSVRSAALRALSRTGDYSAAGAISDLLKDQSEDVRLEAMRTLTRLQELKVEDQKREQQRLQEELRRKQEEEYRKRQEGQQPNPPPQPLKSI
ncbi:MAG: HEAT repeat domain-containing protein, partial [Elusimicrobia bacterium]|nr:HEAT repeat domain-containing protein [Elusimicrobiota bacterium]